MEGAQENGNGVNGRPCSYPPGYRFRPTNEELIEHYLQRKVRNLPLPCNKIVDINISEYNPEELSERYGDPGDKEWYFFTPRDRKYKKGSRPSRAAGNGFWKATAVDKPITSNDQKIGVRKRLVFYKGKPPRGIKTNWIMQEYRVHEANKSPRKPDGSMRLDDWVLCRISKKSFNSDTSTNLQQKDGEETYPVVKPESIEHQPQFSDVNGPVVQPESIDSLPHFSNVNGPVVQPRSIENQPQFGDVNGPVVQPEFIDHLSHFSNVNGPVVQPRSIDYLPHFNNVNNTEQLHESYNSIPQRVMSSDSAWPMNFNSDVTLLPRHNQFLMPGMLSSNANPLLMSNYMARPQNRIVNEGMLSSNANPLLMSNYIARPQNRIVNEGMLSSNANPLLMSNYIARPQNRIVNEGMLSSNANPLLMSNYIARPQNRIVNEGTYMANQDNGYPGMGFYDPIFLS